MNNNHSHDSTDRTQVFSRVNTPPGQAPQRRAPDLEQTTTIPPVRQVNRQYMQPNAAQRPQTGQQGQTRQQQPLSSANGSIPGQPGAPRPNTSRPQPPRQNPASYPAAMSANAQTRVIRTVSSGEQPRRMPPQTGQQYQGNPRPPVSSGTNPQQKRVIRTVSSGNPQPNPAQRPANHSSGRPGGAPPVKPTPPNEGNNRRPPHPPAKKPGKSGYNEGGGALSSIMKAIIYIVFVLVVSGFLSIFGISVCNDVFAFVKSDNEIDVTIPEAATISDIADILKDADVIRFPTIFQIYADLRKDSGKYLAGEYIVSPSMNYDMLLSAFKEKKPPRTEVRITIPEGYTVDEIIALFVDRGMGTTERFVDVIQNYDFDFWFIDEAEANTRDGRRYRLEGYLFPDTYYFFSDSNEETIIYKLLVNFNNKFPEDYRQRCQELGFSVDEIITIASMIQAEAKYESEYSYISSVFHNRLAKIGETVGLLQSDPTLLYVLPELRGKLTSEDMEYDSPYNTYKYKGLPPSSICNPCLSAIQYALYPDETNYLYFYAQGNGFHLFAETYPEHQQNILKVNQNH